MCVVSNVGDFYGQKFAPFVGPTVTTTGGGITIGVPREEFEKLKREVLEMKELLIKAKEIDKKTGQPDCETEDKIKILRAVAEAVGVDLEEVFGA